MLDPHLGRLLSDQLGRAVRSPVHSLLGFLELLGMGDLDGDQRRLVESLAESTQELLGAGDRLILLLKLLSGGHASRTEPVDLASLVSEIGADVDWKVRVQVGPDTPRHVETDAEALRQVLAELVRNAVTHGHAPFTIDVASAPGLPDFPAVRISVSNGGSLSPAARNRLGGAAVGTHETVGVMLVRRLLEVLGGALSVRDSEGIVRVAVTLPIRPAVEDAAPAQPEPLVPARPLRVLLVEDNATNRLLAERQMRKLGHELTGVATGLAGVEAALQGDFDVVLMDRHLPDVDGAEATRQIRAADQPHVAGLPIIAVTADCTEETREACLAAGMDEVLTKPVDLGQLAAALSRVVLPESADLRRPVLAAVTGERRATVPAIVRQVVHNAGGEPVDAAELIATYLGELPGRRLRIQSSLRRGEVRGLIAAAESLRTSSEGLGVTSVAGACAALAAAARRGDLEAARRLLPALSLSTEQIHDELWPYTDEDLLAAAV
jgi:CheY-like chemotaxis protein/HPt (histidine-containing phosphotransfer) domain-containing protein